MPEILRSPDVEEPTGGVTPEKPEKRKSLRNKNIKNPLEVGKEAKETEQQNEPNPEVDLISFRKAEYDAAMKESYKHIEGVGMGSVIEYVKFWHDCFKPDYIVLNDTTAFPMGYTFKEAWKNAYPGEKPPLFFRIDPRTMQKGNYMRQFPEYEKELENFLKTRFIKKDARVFIFDEEPVSGQSSLGIKLEITKKTGIPSENIGRSYLSVRIGDRDLASGDGSNNYRLKLSEKTGESYPEYDNKKAKFRGKILGPGKNRERLEIINDFKLLGKQAGLKMRWQMLANPEGYEEGLRNEILSYVLYRAGRDGEGDSKDLYRRVKETRGPNLETSTQKYYSLIKEFAEKINPNLKRTKNK